MTTTAVDDQHVPDPDALEMVTVKVSDASPEALNWLMAKAQGVEVKHSRKFQSLDSGVRLARFILLREVPGFRCAKLETYDPARNWAQGGPLIDEYDVWLTGKDDPEDPFAACVGLDGPILEGDTKLIAAMRAILTSLIGDSAEVPWFLVDDEVSAQREGV